MDIADYIIVVLLFFSAWDGYRTGFVAQLVRIFGTVLAYVAAWQLHALLTPTIDQWLAHTVLKGVRSPQSIPVVNLFGAGPTVPSLTAAIAGVLSFGVVFFAALLVIRYLGAVLNRIVKLPVLSFLNRTLGLASGVIVAFLIIAVLLDVAAYLPASSVKSQIVHSALAPLFRAPLDQLARMEGIRIGQAG